MKKKMNKRILSLFLCGAMSVSLCSPALAVTIPTDSASGQTTEAVTETSEVSLETEEATPSNAVDALNSINTLKDQTLKAPEHIMWHSSIPGLVKWDPVEGAAEYGLQLYGANEETKRKWKIGDPISVPATTTTYTFDIDSTLHPYLFNVWAVDENGAKGAVAEGNVPVSYDKVNVDSVTVYFDTDGGVPGEMEPLTVKVGEALPRITAPTKEGFVMQGWTDDNGKWWNLSKPVTTSMTLTANWAKSDIGTASGLQWNAGTVGLVRWSSVPGAAGYLLQLYGGTQNDRYEIGDPVEVNARTLTYRFQIDSTMHPYDFSVRVIDRNGNIGPFMFAGGYTYNKVNVSHVDVKFDANGGIPSPLATTRIAVGSPLTITGPAPTPTKKGYVLSGWVNDLGEMWDFNTPVTSAMTLTAVWTAEGAIAAPTGLSWSSSSDGVVNWNAVPDAAKYSVQLYIYDPTGLHPHGDPVTVSSTTHKFDISNTFCVYAFGVKAIDADGVSSAETYSGTKVFDRANTATVTVKFDVNGGKPDPIASVTTRVGRRISSPRPTRDGYVFKGWKYTPSDLWNFSDPVVSDMTLTAMWEAVADVKSTNTNLSSVSVSGIKGIIRGSRVNVTLPAGSVIPTDSNAIEIKTADANATVKDLQYESNGSRWTFTVVAEDGVTTRAYTINVSVRPNGGSSSGGSGSSKPKGTTSSGSYGTSGSSTSTTPAANGTWKLDNVGWWFDKSEGGYPRDAWYECFWNGAMNWYHFNAEGYADGGWLTDKDGNTYYLHNLHDNSFGYMYTGWNWIDGKCYYFNTVSGANGLPYGAMLKNTATPDGYTVDANGVWTVDGVVQTK